ncbi:MAG: S41 family peptidase [Flavobacteriaceae bacterium]
MNTKLPLFIVLLFLIASCQPKRNTKKESMYGTWQSIGYGKILKIDSAKYQYYDITKVSCLPSKEGDISEIKNSIEVLNDTLAVKRGFNFYYYTRATEFDDLCKKNITDKNDPLLNFEVFSETLKNHYAYFELNGINWDAVYKKAKEKINPNTSEVELYLIMQEVIDTLKDNHGYIEHTDKVYELAEEQKAKEEGTNKLKEYGDFEIADLVAKHFIIEDLTQDSWLINWGKMENNIGYIQIKTMFLYGDLSLNDSLIKENGFVSTYMDEFNTLSYEEQIEKEVAGVRNIMEKVMQDLKDTQSIIIDVRFNGGGQDAVSLEILHYFNVVRKQVASKKAQYKNGFTKKTPIYLEAVKNPYTQPVYLLTSQQSASATDMLALASLEVNHLKRIGSHTNGAISDALEKTLPNEWYFSVSNEIYTDMQGKCYENIGIPVDFELNYPEDRQTFFRWVADDLEADKMNILNAIKNLDVNEK